MAQNTYTVIFSLIQKVRKNVVGARQEVPETSGLIAVLIKKSTCYEWEFFLSSDKDKED